MQTDKKTLSRLITNAGKRHLGPLGLIQNGRSRFWEDDRNWFVIGVNFESSSFAQGSRLDVGCNWLWMVKAYFSYDVVAGPIVPFIPFQSEEQFQPIVEEMAVRAAEEVIRYRGMFATYRSAAKYYIARKPEGIWPNFHGAIACVLAGETTEADHFFSQVLESDNDSEWARNARLDAARLQTLICSPNAFRDAVIARIKQSRTLRKLQQCEEINFG